MIRDLRELGWTDIEEFGNKACSLGVLMREGFRVPLGFCVSARFSRLTNPLCVEVRDRLLRLRMPVCVRSSANCEDSPHRSYAGIFESVLNLEDFESTFRAMRTVVISAKSKYVRLYMGESGRSKIKVALIVQEMLHSDYSGIAFTVDPIGRRHILIEIAPGSCEKVAGGEITPSTFLVDRRTCRVRGGQQVHEIGGRLLKEIARISLEAEEVFGCPQDIEFGVKGDKVFLFQSRPITASGDK